jgi:hypothetical protein
LNILGPKNCRRCITERKSKFWGRPSTLMVPPSNSNAAIARRGQPETSTSNRPLPISYTHTARRHRRVPQIRGVHFCNMSPMGDSLSIWSALKVTQQLHRRLPVPRVPSPGEGDLRSVNGCPPNLFVLADLDPYWSWSCDGDYLGYPISVRSGYHQVPGRSNEKCCRETSICPDFSPGFASCGRRGRDIPCLGPSIHGFS